MDLIVEVYECCFAKSMFNGVMHPNNFMMALRGKLTLDTVTEQLPEEG